MKPTVQIIDETERANATHRRVPVTDSNYQAVGIGGYTARCSSLDVSNSFQVTRAYFEGEAHRDFLAETAVFSAVMLTVCLPLFQAAHAVLGLIR